MLPGKQYTPVDYAAMAWRHRWLIVVPAIFGLYAALIVSSRLPNTYRSEMLLQVVPQRIPDSYVRSTITTRTEDRISSLIEQIKSRTELERLITQMNLYPLERGRMPMQDVVDIMRNSIDVQMVGGGRNQDPDSFYVRFQYWEPQTASRVTERLGAMFIDVNARDRGNLAQATDNFMQTQLTEAKRKLEEHDLKLQRFREQNAGRLPTEVAYNMQAMQNAQVQLQQLGESLARDRDSKLTLERLYEGAQIEAAAVAQAQVQVPLAPPAVSPQQPTAAVPTGTTSQQLAQSRDALRMLEVTKTPDHPDVQRVKRVIKELEDKLAQETRLAEAAAKSAAPAGAAPPTPALTPAPSAAQAAASERMRQMAAQIESLQRQIVHKEAQQEPLRQRLADLQRRIEQVPGIESEWVSLTRDYDTLQENYKDLLSKSQDAKRAADLEQRQVGEQFRIVDPARTPVRPTGVNRLEVNAIGAAAGLALGVLLAAFFEFRDSTFRTADDVSGVFNLPVVALVPRLVSDKERRRTRARHWLLSTGVVALILAGGYGFWILQLWKHLS
jgi:polysaccharide chain length determinant protein (PEP-CTERM system associated)